MAGPWDDEEEELPPPADKGEYCEMCRVTGKWLHLNKCPMCHKYFCDNCRYNFGGKDFCTAHCGNEFFWGEDDEDE